jgi:prepilin-type N-terminal cleavage/methylation domain-containing protein
MKTKLRNQKGFTIIEVLIVLAIAGLILLIVFLAVPALQRNQRNTGRKGDVGRLGGAATEFVSNQNGSLPGTGAATLSSVGPPPVPANDAGKIIATAGKLSQYDFVDTGGTPSNFSVVAAATAVPADIGKIQLAIKATCVQPINGTTTAGSNRQMAIQYTVERAGGTADLCIDI